MSNFRIVDRLTRFLLPPSVEDWLPERHLARFVVEVVESLDLRSMTGGYRGSGSASYHPSMLLALLIYGYATGVFSSRKLERATYDSVAFRFIAGNDHPDHDTIAAFRKRFLKEIEALFVRVLMLAKEMGVLQMGTVALDGTKIAERHLLEAIDRRPKTVEVFLVSGGGERRERAAMKGAFERDDAVALRAPVRRLVFTCRLDRTLHGLGAGILEKHHVGETCRAQAVGDPVGFRDLVEI